MASGNLPLTGLPVWLVLLAGLTALTVGAFFYRRRHAAADLTAH
jgi:LPXTG-motif cell wall-anchored protein